MLADGLILIGDSAVTRELISRRGSVFPTSPVNGQNFQLNIEVEGNTPGIYTYSESQSLWIQQTDSERDPYDMSISILGRPKPDDIVAQSIAVRTSIIAPNFDKSRAVTQVVSTSQAVFNISILDSSGALINNLGTLTFDMGARFGTFSATIADKAMMIQPGELLSIKAPLVRDATLKEISITLAGRLAVLNN
jgi:hypothetical protein